MKDNTRKAPESPSPRKIRIVWLSSARVGTDTVTPIIQMPRVLNNLSQFNAEVHLIARSSEGIHQEKLNTFVTLFPIKHVPIISRILYVLALFFSMPFYVNMKKADFVITDAGTAIIGFALKVFLPLTKLKVVLDIRSTPLRTWQGTQGLKDSLIDTYTCIWFSLSLILAKKKFDGITIVTELMKKEICDRFRVNPNFVGVWTSGVSPSIFSPRKFDGKEIKKSLGLSGKFVIFYHGSLRPHGLVPTFKALSLLNAKQQNMILFLLSSQSTFVRFWHDLAEELGIQNNVILHGKVSYEEVPKYIAMSDLPIIPLPNNPNWIHQSPLKLLEYLAMEKAVILTNIPAHREILGKSKSGIFISSVEPEVIAEAITYAYRNQENLGKWGVAGRSIVQDEYSWESIAKVFKDYLLHL